MSQAELQVILTRAAQDNLWLAAELRKLEILVLEAPALEFSELEIAGLAEKTMQEFLAGKFQICVFSSKNAAHFFKQHILKLEKNFTWPEDCQIAVVGAGTALSVKKYFGVSAKIISKEGNAHSLVEQLLEFKRVQQILLLKPKKSLPQIEFEFQKLGSRLSKLDCYQTIQCVHKEYVRALESAASKIIVFFSPSAVQASIESFGLDVLRECRIVSIGKTTSAAVRAQGLEVWKQAQETNEVSVLSIFKELKTIC